MRLKDRQCNDSKFINGVLDKANELFLAINADDWPYCIPVNFARVEKRLYIHSALEGRKLELITSNPRVAFSCAIDIEIDTTKSTTYYKSVCGQGLAEIVKDDAEKGQALDALAKRYNAKCVVPAPPANIRRVAIIRIDILELSGKRSLRV